ncbi:hypothetical protein OC835_007078 [Tilletia horrida]|nr:hypothetical protein OC835_007078 [Tilletia horrida]
MAPSAAAANAPPLPNATADQLPGQHSSSSSSSSKDDGIAGRSSTARAGTSKVAQAAQATATASTPSAPPPPSAKNDDNGKANAPAPAANTLTNILGHYASTARPSTARIDPTAATNTTPIALTIGNLWRYIPLVASAGMSIGSAIASHAIYGPPKKSWGVEMSVFTRIMRDCGQQSEFATIAGLQQFFDLGSLLPVPKDGLITPVTFRVKKRNLKGFLSDADAAEDGKRELTGEWVVTKSTWKRLQSEWRKTSAGGTENGTTTSAPAQAASAQAQAQPPLPPGAAAQRSKSVPDVTKGTGTGTGAAEAAAKPSSGAVNGSARVAPATNGSAQMHGNANSKNDSSRSSNSINTSTSTTASSPAADIKRSASTRNGNSSSSSSGASGRRERIIYYIHGGAYFVMSAATHRPLTISLSKYAECRVFAINYRLAPDTKFPGALHDCVSAWFRLVEDLGIPPKNIVLGADSAGGGLALALLCYLRDEKYELPAGAMLFSPWVDLTLSCDSWDTNAKYDYLPMPPSGSHMNPVHAYLGDDIDKYLTHPYVSPLFADLHGLPPLLIQCGDAEVLRDEGTLLAHKASLAGVSVRHELYEDCVHVFQAFLFLDASRKALQSARHFMRTGLDRPSSVSRSKSKRAAAAAAAAARRSSSKAGPGGTANKASADPKAKLLAEAAAAAASSAEDTGTETEGDEKTAGGRARGTAGGAGAQQSSLLDAATRDRMDAEMRSGMGNVRGQRVEPSTGERERRHHHHHLHHHGSSSRKSGAVMGGAASGKGGNGTAAPAATAAAETSGTKQAGTPVDGDATAPVSKQDSPASSSSSSSSSSDDNDDEDDDDAGEDEDEEFAYARTKKGSIMGGAASSAAAAFKAMQKKKSAQQVHLQQQQHQQRSLSSSSLSQLAGDGGERMNVEADGEADADDDVILAAFHPPKAMLTPRMRQSSLSGLPPFYNEFAAAAAAANEAGATATTDPSLSSSSSSSTAELSLALDEDAAAAAAAGRNRTSSTPTASAAQSPLDSTSASTSASASASASASSASSISAGSRPTIGGRQRSSHPQLPHSSRSSAALSSLMESYAANPGVLRTNVWTPAGEGAGVGAGVGGSGSGAGGGGSA